LYSDVWTIGKKLKPIVAGENAGKLVQGAQAMTGAAC